MKTYQITIFKNSADAKAIEQLDKVIYRYAIPPGEYCETISILIIFFHSTFDLDQIHDQLCQIDVDYFFNEITENIAYNTDPRVADRFDKFLDRYEHTNDDNFDSQAFEADYDQYKSDLQTQLDRAVSKEQYLKAAKIRDRINQQKTKHNGNRI